MRTTDSTEPLVGVALVRSIPEAVCIMIGSWVHHETRTLSGGPQLETQQDKRALHASRASSWGIRAWVKRRAEGLVQSCRIFCTKRASESNGKVFAAPSCTSAKQVSEYRVSRSRYSQLQGEGYFRRFCANSKPMPMSRLAQNDYTF